MESGRIFSVLILQNISKTDFFHSNTAQYFQNRQTIHNLLDLPNTYPTVRELSDNKNKSMRPILGTQNKAMCELVKTNKIH